MCYNGIVYGQPPVNGVQKINHGDESGNSRKVHKHRIYGDNKQGMLIGRGAAADYDRI